MIVSELFVYNRSTLFLLGTIGLDNKQLKPLGLVNCYLRDENKPEYEGLDVLLLLFEVRVSTGDSFRFFVEKEKVRTPLFIDEYDYDEGYVVLVYEIPGKFSEDLEKFKKGQYSRFSEEFINTLTMKVEVIINGSRSMVDSVQNMIVHKSKQFKEMIETDLNCTLADEDELWSIPDLDEESITIPPKKKIK